MVSQLFPYVGDVLKVNGFDVKVVSFTKEPDYKKAQSIIVKGYEPKLDGWVA